MDIIRDLLSRNRSDLVNNLDIKYGLLNELVSNKVIQADHLESIKALGTTAEQIERLIDILRRRSPDDFKMFLKILDDHQPHVSSLFDEIEFDHFNNDVNGNNLPVNLSGEKNFSGRSTYSKLVRELKYTKEDNMQLKEGMETNNKELEKMKVELLFAKRDLETSKEECEMLKKELKQSKDENDLLKEDIKSKIKKISESESLLERKTEENKRLELKLIEFEEKYPKFQNELVTKGNNIQVKGGCSIMGVAMLHMRIYIVCLKSKRLYVFSDEPPYAQQFSEEFEIQDLNNARDIVSSEKEKVLFISDQDNGDNHKIRKVSVLKVPLLERSKSCYHNPQNVYTELPRQQSLDLLDNDENMNKVVSYDINRKPSKMFACQREDRQVGTLLVVLTSSLDAKCSEEYFVYIYKAANMEVLRMILLNIKFGDIFHVLLQPSMARTSQNKGFNNAYDNLSSDDLIYKTNFIVSHKTRETLENGEIKSVWLISKVSPDGSNLISSSSPQVDGIDFNESEHVALAEGCRILVADQKNDRLVILGPKCIGSQVLVKKDSKYRFEKPSRIVYNPKKRMVLVTHWDKKGILTILTH